MGRFSGKMMIAVVFPLLIEQSCRLNNNATYGKLREYTTLSNLW